jgi:hypothetical protein
VELSEILGLAVLGENASHVGTVVDVRVVVRSDLDQNPDPPRLFGLVVSPRTRSSYLGYERSDARRPAMLAALLRWRHRGTFLALWEDVARIDAETVCLRDGFSRYSPTLRNAD